MLKTIYTHFCNRAICVVVKVHTVLVRVHAVYIKVNAVFVKVHLFQIAYTLYKDFRN